MDIAISDATAQFLTRKQKEGETLSQTLERVVRRARQPYNPKYYHNSEVKRKKWREAHKEEIKARRKAYYQKNKEKFKEQYQQRKEEIRQRYQRKKREKEAMKVEIGY